MSNTYLSPPSAPPVDPEQLAEPDVERYTMPLDQLPPIDGLSADAPEFWSSRQLRPEGEGSSYHNLPVLRFGINYDYESGEAVLTIPTRRYVNQVVAQFNNGGFRVVASDNELTGESADQFLDKLRRKEFPQSDSPLRVVTIGDKLQIFLAGNEESAWPREPNATMRVHDRVDHLGLVTMPEPDADSVAQAAGRMTELPETEKDAAVLALDRALDNYSAYALASGGDPLDSPNHDTSYKDFCWNMVAHYLFRANLLLIGLTVEQIKDNEFLKANADVIFEKLRAQLDEGKDIKLDRYRCDQKIQEMQSLSATALDDAREAA